VIRKPYSRAALVLFDVEKDDILVDCGEYGKQNCCEVVDFGTSIVIDNGRRIEWASQKSPIDLVVLYDKRPQATKIHSVLKGCSGEIEKYHVDYNQSGILAVFTLRQQPQRHDVFTQKWRFSYYLDNRRVVVSSDPNLGVVSQTYK
jgi:hypothetical protein